MSQYWIDTTYIMFKLIFCNIQCIYFIFRHFMNNYLRWKKIYWIIRGKLHFYKSAYNCEKKNSLNRAKILEINWNYCSIKSTNIAIFTCYMWWSKYTFFSKIISFNANNNNENISNGLLFYLSSRLNADRLI